MLVTFVALTHDGARGASFPITIVQAASLDVLLCGVTDLTLILCGCLNKTFRDQSNFT